MHRVQVDTTRETERVVGELVTDPLTFNIAGEQQSVSADGIQYYTNLDSRTGTVGHGTLYLRDNTVLPWVQLLSRIEVRTGIGLMVTREGREIVMLNLDTASF
jgi:hypothetical protein